MAADQSVIVDGYQADLAPFALVNNKQGLPCTCTCTCRPRSESLNDETPLFQMFPRPFMHLAGSDL